MFAFHLISLFALCLVAVACLSLFLYHAITGVPTMSASKTEIRDVVSLLKDAALPENAVIYDLGSGWGTVAMAVAKAIPNATVRAIEISPFPYVISRIRTRGLINVTVERRNFFKCDLTDADAITCYLMPSSINALVGVFDKSLKPGTSVVAVTFWFRGRKPQAIREGVGLRGAVALYRWNSAGETGCG